MIYIYIFTVTHYTLYKIITNTATGCFRVGQEFMQQQAPQFMPPPPAAGGGPSQVPVWQQQAEQGGPPEVWQLDLPLAYLASQSFRRFTTCIDFTDARHPPGGRSKASAQGTCGPCIGCEIGTQPRSGHGQGGLEGLGGAGLRLGALFSLGWFFR